jgi:type IV pilus assembly protein PilW
MHPPPFMKNPRRRHNHYQGFTLLEMLVALFLGTFLLDGVLQIFASAKLTYKLQENLARLQENGRIAIDAISQDIRMAGYWGCHNTSPNTDLLQNPNHYDYQFSRGLQGFEAMADSSSWQPSLDASFLGATFAETPITSDVITIRKASNKTFTVKVEHHDTAVLELDDTNLKQKLEDAEIRTTSTVAKQPSIMIMTDPHCDHSEAFQVDYLEGENLKIATNSTLHNVYPGGSQIQAINTISYYVATNANNEKMLYRKIDGANAEVWVDGVEQMKIFYGVDQNSDRSADYYVAASGIPANKWGDVVSVRIHLLLATLEDNLISHPASYYYFNQSDNKMTTDDRKIRHEFTATITLRNSLQNKTQSL